MAQIDAKCHYCGVSQPVNVDFAGEQVTCSACGWKFSIPFESVRNQGSSPSDRSEFAARKPQASSPYTLISVSAVFAGAFALVLFNALRNPGGGENSSSGGTPSTALDSSNTGFMGQTPDQAAREVLDQISSTPAGRAAVDHIAQKNDQLDAFQAERGYSDRIVEAAIKEWVTTHGGNYDWNLEQVKKICVRNARYGIRNEFRTESERNR